MTNYINFQPITKLVKLAINPPNQHRVIPADRLNPADLDRHLRLQRELEERRRILEEQERIRDQRRDAFQRALQPDEMIIPGIHGGRGFSSPNIGFGGQGFVMDSRNMFPFIYRALPPDLQRQVTELYRQNPLEAQRMMAEYYFLISQIRPGVINDLMRGDPKTISEALAAARIFGVPADRADWALTWLRLYRMLGIDVPAAAAGDQQPMGGGAQQPGAQVRPGQVNQGQPPQAVQPNLMDMQVAAMVANPQLRELLQQQQQALRDLNVKTAEFGLKLGPTQNGLSTAVVPTADNLKAYLSYLDQIAKGQIPNLPPSYQIAAALSLRTNKMFNDLIDLGGDPNNLVAAPDAFSNVLRNAAEEKSLKVFYSIGGVELAIDDPRIPPNLREMIKKDLEKGWKVLNKLNDDPGSAELNNEEIQAYLKRIIVYMPRYITITQGQNVRPAVVVVPTTAFELWKEYQNADGNGKAVLWRIIEANVIALGKVLPPDVLGRE